MGTGTSRAAAAVALSLLLAACGGAAQSAFGWLRPQPPPGAWRTVTIPTGATLAFPAAWQRQHSDAGTATAVLQRPDGTYLGYVNLTPRQGDETLANWASFRVDHNAEEGDRNVVRLAAARNLAFRGGHGSCVKDAYTSNTGARYVEIACLVQGAHGATVIVAAAPPGAWASESATLEREVEAVTA